MTRGRLALSVLWLAGAGVAAWLTPTGPRDGWQPPAGQSVVALLPDGRTLLTADSGSSLGRALTGPVVAWDGDTGTRLWAAFGPRDVIAGVIAVPGGDLVAVQRLPPALPADAVYPNVVPMPVAVEFFAARTGTPRGSVPSVVENGQGMWLAFAADGRTVAVTGALGDPGRIDVFDLATGIRRRSVPGRPGMECLSADGSRVATLTGNAVVVTAVATGDEVARIPQAIRPPPADRPPPALSPDGTLLLDAAGDVYDVATGRLRYGVGRSLYGRRFSADGRWLLAAGGGWRNVTLDRRDAATGAALAAQVAAGPATRVVWSPDGTAVVAMRYETPPRIAARRWLADTTGAEWLADRRTQSTATVTIDAATGRPRWHTGVTNWEVDWAGGRMVGYDPATGEGRIWGMPPRRPVRWVALAVAAWTAVFAAACGVLIGGRRWGKQERSSV